MRAEGERPPHHGPAGRFRNPWPVPPRPPSGRGDVVKWLWQRWREGRPPNPSPEELPRKTPELAEPRVPVTAEEVRVTWIGHASFLLQLPGFTVLTDPVFSRRASPVQWAGPARLSPPGLELDTLPPVDAVLLSHDHYDHLDTGTVDRLRERYGPELTWLTPLGYRDWFGRRGVDRVVELDWWETAAVDLVHTAEGGEDDRAHLRCLPARHWTRRRLFDARKRLWCSWALETRGRRIYFGGDSGYGPFFRDIGERAGPFDLAILPVGAYDPRWFMRSSHMNPEEAAQACRDVRARAMVGMHWGTFRLADDPPLEPPVRTRRAWEALGLPAANLHMPALGETLRL